VQKNKNHGQININRHLRDFLHFEDNDNLNSPNNEYVYADHKLMQTTTMPNKAVTKVTRTNPLVLSDSRKKIADLVSTDQEQVSELIANIDYNIS